jgi:hypothetical protein
MDYEIVLKQYAGYIKDVVARDGKVSDEVILHIFETCITYLRAEAFLNDLPFDEDAVRFDVGSDFPEVINALA